MTCEFGQLTFGGVPVGTIQACRVHPNGIRPTSDANLCTVARVMLSLEEPEPTTWITCEWCGGDGMDTDEQSACPDCNGSGDLEVRRDDPRVG